MRQKAAAEKAPVVEGARPPRGSLAYERLREAIRTGALKPGERIREDDVAAWLAMSRTPVREALRRLESDGLLVHEPHRGVVLARLDREMVTELYFMRDVLESSAAHLAAQEASNAEIALLRELVAREADLGDDPRKLAEHNLRFHHAIHRCAHNRYLLKTLDALRDALMLLGPTTYTAAGRAAMALREHQMIVEAIADRDPEFAQAAARAHIRAAQRERLKMMSLQEAAGE